MSTDAVGGVWTYAVGLARCLASRRVQTQLAVLGPEPSAAQLRQATGIDGLHVAATGLALDWTATSGAELDDAVAELKRHALASGADLVHLNAPGHAGQEAWGVPLVITAHSCVATWWRATHSGQLPLDLAWRAHRSEIGMSIADAVIAPSRSFAAELESAYGDKRHIDVVHNARHQIESSGASSRDCVLTVGRLWDPCKNAELIDRACAMLDEPIYAAGSTQGPNGEAPKFEHLKQLGSLDETTLQGWYERARIFISVSRYEPFGLSVLEAAQSGCALVLSDISTFRELWDGAAVFVPVNDESALAEAIHRLNSDHQACADLARHARERAARFTVARHLAGTLAVYRKALTSQVRVEAARSAA